MPTKAEAGLDATECLLRRGLAVQRIPGIHGAQDGEVGVGVEALDEPLALVIEIAGDIEAAADQASAMLVEAPRIFAVAVGIAAEPLVETGRPTCS